MSNMLKDTHPDIAKEWHPTKNGETTVDKVSSGSHKKAWWLGNCGHEWEGVIRNRVNRNSGCHYCAGKKVLIGFNDLVTLKPEIVKEWHPALNKTTPENYTSRSNTKVWWQCVNGHEWEAPISYRTGDRGGGCSYCLNQKVLEGFNDLGTLNSTLAAEWNNDKNGQLKTSEVSSGADKKVWWKCVNGHEWEAKIYDRNGKKSGCPTCVTGYKVSKPEKEIVKMIKELAPSIVVKINTKSVIKPYELDVYIPEKKIAIEYNGLYWHSEDMGKDKNYHYNKWLSCKEKGIQLIQIWEDDWNRNPEIVKNMIAHKLGVSNKESFYARNTKAQIITKKEADNFLNKNHIQGTVGARLAYGLFDKGHLIAVMLFKNEANSNGKTLNLLRYATSEKVVGGFTKLLKFAEKQNPAVTSIVTFSDNTISDGGLYANNGFVENGAIKPDYMYIVGGLRVHKFNYRLKRFEKDPNLKWLEGFTETQLATLNNIPKIWDAGKIRYLKKVKH
jgi:very-short-patch-repair endonuclease